MSKSSCHLYGNYNKIMVYCEELKHSLKSRHGAAQVPRTVPLRKCHHLKWGNMGYIMNEKGFCNHYSRCHEQITSNRLQETVNGRSIRTSSNPEHEHQHAIVSGIKLLAYRVFFHVLSTIMVAAWALTKD